MQRWAARPPPTMRSSMGPASARPAQRAGNRGESFRKRRSGLPGPGQRDAAADPARPVALDVDADPPARLLRLGRALLRLLDRALDRLDERAAVLLDLRGVV